MEAPNDPLESICFKVYSRGGKLLLRICNLADVKRGKSIIFMNMFSYHTHAIVEVEVF